MATATQMAKVAFAEDHRNLVNLLNETCAELSKSEFDNKIAEVKKAEKEYTKILEKEVFSDLSTPRDALAMHDFTTISHKVITDDGVTVGVELADKVVKIDLYRYCKYKGFSASWFPEIEALNIRLTLRKAQELSVSERNRLKIVHSYLMDKMLGDIKLGEHPTSNTQIIRHVQKIADMIYPGLGRVTKDDFWFILSCYTKQSKSDYTEIIPLKHKALASLLYDMFSKIVNERSYSVGYRQNDDLSKKFDTEFGSKSDDEVRAALLEVEGSCDPTADFDGKFDDVIPDTVVMPKPVTRERSSDSASGESEVPADAEFCKGDDDDEDVVVEIKPKSKTARKSSKASKPSKSKAAKVSK